MGREEHEALALDKKYFLILKECYMIFMIMLLCILGSIGYLIGNWFNKKDEKEAKRQIEKQAEEQNDWQQLHYIKTKELYEVNKGFYDNNLFIKSIFLCVIIIFMGLVIFTYIKDVEPIFDHINQAIKIENLEKDNR